jgi:hypothetical protein
MVTAMAEIELHTSIMAGMAGTMIAAIVGTISAVYVSSQPACIIAGAK